MSDSKAEWRRRRIAAGLCVSCGKKRHQHATMCDLCEKRKRELRRELDRLKNNWSAWRPGSRGRKPID